ncbi:MAG: hypothetical protein NTY23_12340, partial [Chloroflexi bacterium]|nr:hypothetical protein [Chloroflexota bacterium]
MGSKRVKRQDDSDFRKRLEEALRQPGIREALAVYEGWYRLEKISRQQRRATAPATMTSASNSS